MFVYSMLHHSISGGLREVEEGEHEEPRGERFARRKYVYMYMCMYVYMSVYIYIYIHIYIYTHIYIYIYIHTYMYTYIHMNMDSFNINSV